VREKEATNAPGARELLPMPSNFRVINVKCARCRKHEPSASWAWKWESTT